MKIEEYLRNKVKEHFINLVKEDHCEYCGSNENLEVHHMKQFIEILYNSLDKLDIDYRCNAEDYSNEELDIIVHLVLGYHLTNDYKTLCNKCHKDYHKQFGRKTLRSKRKSNLFSRDYYVSREIVDIDTVIGDF